MDVFLHDMGSMLVTSISKNWHQFNNKQQHEYNARSNNGILCATNQHKCFQMCRTISRQCQTYDTCGILQRYDAFLVGGLEVFYFPYIGNVIIPTGFHIFQRG